MVLTDVLVRNGDGLEFSVAFDDNTPWVVFHFILSLGLESLSGDLSLVDWHGSVLGSLNGHSLVRDVLLRGH